MTYDCIMVGGGAAGLSAALVLGRARKRTLRRRRREPSNLPAHAIGGLLGHDGRPPAEFYALAREQLEPPRHVELRGGHGHRAPPREASRSSWRAARPSARRILLATGMEYRPPDIPGLEPLWGDTVFHCPFCHGWEVRDQPLAVLAEDEKADHLMPMIRSWSDDVVLLDPDRPSSSSSPRTASSPRSSSRTATCCRARRSWSPSASTSAPTSTSSSAPRSTTSASSSWTTISRRPCRSPRGR